jgi:hypothetical protein
MDRGRLKTMTDTLPVNIVQNFLDNIGGRVFTVTFLKKDGSLRVLTGMIDDNGKRMVNVPVMDVESGSWKSFNINNVVCLEVN